MNEMVPKQCFLKSVNETHPHIELNANDAIFVGRTPETKLCDTFVSKKHIQLRADFDKNVVIFEVLGINVSTLNGKILERNKEYTACNGDIIEVIQSKYPYKIHFVNCEIDKPMIQIEPRKRKLSSDSKMEIENGKRRKWQIHLVRDSKLPFPNETTWESFNDGKLIVYTAPDCVASNKIGAYDMDGTLITTKSGKVFPTNADDWKLAYGTVINTLKAKYADKYKIAILTNQAGVSSGKTKLVDIKKKIENILKTLSIPIQVFISTGEGVFRKPLTGMWQALCDHKNENIIIDTENSYYVGDAAGRPENKIMKRKKDHSCVDRLLALNLNLTFFTPEEHFLKGKMEKWVQPEFNPQLVWSNISINLIEPQDSKLTSTNLELIVMVGGPGSGKSRFCKDNLALNNYEVINRDRIGTWQKCVDRVNDCLKAGQKVVVDNTNGNRESRLRYINAAKKNNVSCRCFVMATSFKHAEHNVAFRELIDSSHSKISKIVLNGYKKNYEEPSLDEGFVEIVRVNFVPKFDNESEKTLYGMYLLSS